MKVSIIIPVYNDELYLEECLNSVINQTIDEKEIIIVNDGSTDLSLTILEKYKQKYPKIILINQTNQGVSVARNVALDIATGEYIGFVDADDYVDLDMYKIMYDKAKKNNADLLTCSYKKINKNRIFDFKTKKQKKFLLNEIVDKYFTKEIISMVTLSIFKKTILLDNKFPINMLYSEDNHFFFEAILKCTRIVCLKESLYYYRIRENSASNRGFNPNIWNILVTINNNEKLLKKNNLYNKYAEQINVEKLKAILLIISSYSTNKLWSTNQKINNINRVLSKFFTRIKIYNLAKIVKEDSFKVCINKLELKFYLKCPKASILIEGYKWNLLNKIRNDFPNLFFILKKFK